MNENCMQISETVFEYANKLNSNDAKDLLLVTIMPLVCTVIEDLINEGKIKLC